MFKESMVFFDDAEDDPEPLNSNTGWNKVKDHILSKFF